MAEVEEKGDVFRAIIEVQRSIGELAATAARSIGELSVKTDRLISDVASRNIRIEATNVKVDALRMRLAWLAGASAALGFLFATALAVAKFLPLAASTPH